MPHRLNVEKRQRSGKTVCGGVARESSSLLSFRSYQPFFITTMPIAVGSKAPDFTLKSKTADGLVDVKLSANFGVKQTVILFFPLAYTGVCTQEMCDQTSGLGDYEKLGASVYPISVDSPFAQEAWANANKIGITLLSDLNKETTKAYEVLFPIRRRQGWRRNLRRADRHPEGSAELRRDQGRPRQINRATFAARAPL